MANEPLPDDVLKFAETLRERARNEPNSEVRERLLESAEKFQKLDERARSVLAEGEANQVRVRNMHGGPIDHRSWEFWLAIAIGIGTFLFLYLLWS